MIIGRPGGSPPGHSAVETTSKELLIMALLAAVPTLIALALVLS